MTDLASEINAYVGAKSMAPALSAKRSRGRPRTIKAAPGPATPAKGLDRSLKLIEILATEEGLSLTDVALRTGVASSTAHRILATLEVHKFVMHDEERDLWFIGVKAFQIGNAFLRNRKLVDIGRLKLHELSRDTGESVNLAIEDEGSVVFISQVESHAAIRSFHRPGSRGVMHASGVGKALLAAMDDEMVSKLLHNTGLEKFTGTTLISPADLFCELEKIRQCGWAADDEERTVGMRCVAAAIYNEYAEAIAALSISGPTSRLTDNKIGELGPLVKRTASEITESIGGVVPVSGSKAGSQK